MLTPTPIPVSVNNVPTEAWDVLLRYLATFALPIILALIAKLADRKKPAEDGSGKSAATPVPSQPLPIKEQAEAMGALADTLSKMAERYEALQKRQDIVYDELNESREENYRLIEKLRFEFEQEKRRMLARNAALDKRIRYLHNGIDTLILQLRGYGIEPAWRNGQKFDISSGGNDNAS